MDKEIIELDKKEDGIGGHMETLCKTGNGTLITSGLLLTIKLWVTVGLEDITK